MHTTSSNIHWLLNLLWKRLKTTTPWSLLPTWRLTSIRSNPLSRSCTTLKCAKLTRWLGMYLCLWIIIEIRILLFFLSNLNFGDFHNSKSWQKIYIEITQDIYFLFFRPDGQKKAYVRLAPDYDALDVASKIGII